MLQFGQIPAKQGDVQFDLDVSDDRRALTVTFSEFVIHVGGGKSPTTNATRLTCLTLPLNGDEARVEMEVIVQGFVLTHPGTTGTAICSVNGQTTVFDIPGARDESFVQKLTFTADTPSDARLCLFLLLGRDSSHVEAEAHLNLSSIDVELLPRPPQRT